jgi:type II secretory pathway component PulF
MRRPQVARQEMHGGPRDTGLVRARVREGKAESESPQPDTQRNGEHGLAVELTVRIAAQQAAGKSRFRKRVKGRHLATLYGQLADLLHSGVPLLRALDILERQSAHPALSDVLREVRGDVADGTSLADAMAKHPPVFNELTVSMIRAGQEGGFLEDVLKRVADFTEHEVAVVFGGEADDRLVVLQGLLSWSSTEESIRHAGRPTGWGD